MSDVSSEDELAGLFTDEQYAKALKVLVAKARTCFLTYFHLFNPQGHSPLILGDLHRYLIGLVQRVYDGDDPPNNAVSVPPQHGKSTILSIEAPSWVLGVWPRVSIAITGFSNTLVRKFSREIRERLDHPLYHLVFPGVVPVRGSDRVDDWATETGGTVMAKPSGSKLVGRRVDWLIMDDVHPGRAEAESPTMRQKVVEWYWADCFTRLHPESKQFLIGTRWHPHDLIGSLTSEEYLEQLEAEGQLAKRFHTHNLPAIAEGKDDPLGRKEGDPLFPEERPLSYLKGVRASVPNYEWRSQYQCDPQSASSGHIDLANLIYFRPNEIPWDEIDEINRGWDLALSEKQTADFTVGALVGVNYKTKAIYILDIVRQRMSWAKMKPRIVKRAYDDLKGWGPELKLKGLRMGMEGVAGFKIAVDEVREELLGDVQVLLKNPPSRKEGGGSKLLRAQPWLNKLEKGLVHVVRTDWTKDFIDELDQFPDGNHDDQVDAVSIAHEMLEKKKQLLIA